MIVRKNCLKTDQNDLSSWYFLEVDDLKSQQDCQDFLTYLYRMAVEKNRDGSDAAASTYLPGKVGLSRIVNPCWMTNMGKILSPLNL